jgi:hypothetical protein
VRGVFAWADVFPLIVPARHQRPLPEQKLIEHRQELALPVALALGDERPPIGPQRLEPFLPERAASAEPGAPERAHPWGHGPALVSRSRGEREAEPFALLMQDARPLAAVEPAPAAWATRRRSGPDWG